MAKFREKRMQGQTRYDVLIAGGGPAGTSAAIGLAQDGARVLLLEKERFPRHKLCGEFISPECAGHFAWLGVASAMASAGGAALRETVFYGRGGRGVKVPSEWFGGAGAALGLSRAAMDERLLQRAREVGVEVWEETTATGLLRDADGRVAGARTSAGEARARVTLDATGRGRVLARRVDNKTAKTRPPLVAFKAHLAGAEGAPNACEIYFYRGGYGGLNSVEGGAGNLCFIVPATDAKRFGGDAGRVMREVVMQNRRAAQTLARAVPVTNWLAVALERFGSFAPAPAPGLLAAGDAAAFIDPFTGSGMLMALQCGELAAETVGAYLRHGVWAKLAADYQSQHHERFAARLRLASWLRRAAFAPGLAEMALRLASVSEAARLRLAQATRA
jgi:flavin-dependent dehydrogenase